MLVVETVARIRRAYFAQKKPIKVICRELRVSRRVVRKVIRSQATEFRYQRSRQPLPRIDPWRDQLDGLLLENEGKPARERLTLIRIFEELRALGEANTRSEPQWHFAVLYIISIPDHVVGLHHVYHSWGACRVKPR